MTAAPILLAAERVTRHFGGVTAVNDVDLVVRKGSVHGLIGPNGAGKTTLLNLIAGALRVSSGELRFAGEIITRRSPAERARRGVRRTFQNLKLFLEMTALDNVAVGMHAGTRSGFIDSILRSPRHRREEQEIAERSMEALQFVGLGDTPSGTRRRWPMATAASWKSPAGLCRGRRSFSWTSRPLASMRRNRPMLAT